MERLQEPWASGCGRLTADERSRFVELKAVDGEYAKLLQAERYGRPGEAKLHRQRLDAQAQKVGAGDVAADPRALANIEARAKTDAIRESLPFEVRDLLSQKSALDAMGTAKLTPRERLNHRLLRDVEAAYEKLLEAERKGQASLAKVRRQQLERTAARRAKAIKPAAAE